MSKKAFVRSCGVILGLLLMGCSQTDGIDQSGTKFDAISEDATINLLGNEPFWGIEIVPDEGSNFIATYSNPENIDGSAVSVTRFAGNNGLGFAGELDGEPILITVTPGECSDTMSDRIYPYTSTVALGDRTLYGCAYTSDEPFKGGEPG